MVGESSDGQIPAEGGCAHAALSSCARAWRGAWLAHRFESL